MRSGVIERKMWMVVKEDVDAGTRTEILRAKIKTKAY